MRCLFGKLDGRPEIRRLHCALETAHRDKKKTVQELEQTIQASKTVFTEHVERHRTELRDKVDASKAAEEAPQVTAAKDEAQRKKLEKELEKERAQGEPSMRRLREQQDEHERQKVAR